MWCALSSALNWTAGWMPGLLETLTASYQASTQQRGNIRRASLSSGAGVDMCDSKLLDMDQENKKARSNAWYLSALKILVH